MYVLFVIEIGDLDCIDYQILDASAIAASLATDHRATDLLLHALTALCVLTKSGQLFSLASVSAKYLVKSSAHYLGGMILFDGSLWDCWERLSDAVRSGQPARPANMYQDDPRETERFTNAMDSLVKARGDAAIVASALDWTGASE